MFSLIRNRPARSERQGLQRAFTPLVSLRDEMDTLFDQLFNGWNGSNEWMQTRDWKIDETDKEVTMRLELPGFEANEIDAHVEGGDTVVIRAEHKCEGEAKENGNKRCERFENRFTVPTGTNTEAVEASYRNGILELHLPRRPEAMPKRIEVKT